LSKLPWQRLGRYYIATRQFDAAHDAIRRALEIQPEYSSRLSGVAIAEHTLGHSAESQRALSTKEQAFAWLERA
jgi:cytochrome c-type biogenesis protein CcmH/NrfG